MAKVREGNRAALMVVDVQVGVMAECWDAPRVIGNVARLVARARGQGVPVIWVQHSDAELVDGSPPWQWVPELVPAAGEALVHKHYNSAFEDTALDADLSRLGIAHVVLAGAATNWCIRATAYGALDRGYDLTLVGDAHTTGTMQPDDGRAIEAEDIVRELNIALTWVRYPGRRSGVVAAEAVDFAPIGAAGAPLFLTRRLRCRRLDAGDIAPMLAVYGDVEAMRWVGDGSPITLPECEEWVRVTERNYALRGYGMFVVEEIASDRVVGFCGIVHPGGQPEPEVKYAFLRDTWGQGYASEIVHALLRWGAERFALPSIIATVAPENRVSQRVLEKAGAMKGPLRDNDDGSRTQLYVWRAPSMDGQA